LLARIEQVLLDALERRAYERELALDVRDALVRNRVVVDVLRRSLR
jgi:hypothetical protein